MNSDESDFFNHMEAIKPPHEKDVLAFFSAIKQMDVEEFARKLKDEKAHDETLATQQLEDIKKLEADNNFVTEKVIYAEERVEREVQRSAGEHGGGRERLEAKGEDVEGAEEELGDEEAEAQEARLHQVVLPPRTQAVCHNRAQDVLADHRQRGPQGKARAQTRPLRANLHPTFSLLITPIEKEEDWDHLNKILQELKAQIQIENRKKLLIKDKLDQAFLRGASAISIEALLMSQSNMAGISRHHP
eukprot:TRINITY_DN9289_c0_g2_i3.p1 TRINITY_DN9289_c0_g2~~TRINITY_DN9289_c0_g2_i3.p1  ORF type:complete len:246 (-),score=47.67 TRINITY_DN9289_c0_g2_i3:124-861(-)